MIPKVIHYCWYGGKSKPKLINDCILSWKLNLPDYEIIEWNEKNSDLSSPFVIEAYRLKKWAFVADYIRLKVLYENGGIYLDTDMMVIKSLDVILFNECFLGAEDKEFINCAIIGAQKNNKFIKECLSKYEFINISNQMNWCQITIPRIITDVFRNNYNFFLPFDKKIEQDGLVIYPFTYFYPLPYENKNEAKNYDNYLSTDSYAVHLWNESWIEYSEFHYLRNGQYALGLRITLKNILKSKHISVRYSRKILSCIKQSLIKKS
jgi:hypothetical protein